MRAGRLTAVVVAVFGGLVFAAMAVAAANNANVVKNTVYDGEYGESQNDWSRLQVQFEVTSGGEVTNMAGAVAICAPTPPVALARAKIKRDEFTSRTSLGSDFHVTITGQFEKHAHAKGTGTLRTSTILGDPCVETGHWTAKALPQGTELCPKVDPDFVVKTSVTNMSCAKAALAYAAGLREAQKNGSNPNAPFESPGYVCNAPDDDPVPQTICTRGKEVFRLP